MLDITLREALTGCALDFISFHIIFLCDDLPDLVGWALWTSNSANLCAVSTADKICDDIQTDLTLEKYNAVGIIHASLILLEHDWIMTRKPKNRFPVLVYVY